MTPRVARALVPPAGGVPAAETADGRAARGERTRRALAEAMISLIEEGETSPTARRIAERAGVSLRLVFHHFEDVEALFKEAVAVQGERHWRRIRAVPPDSDLRSRVRLVVRSRCDLYEQVAPVRRVAANVGRSSPTISAQLTRSRELLRRQLSDSFVQELRRHRGGSRRRLLDAVDAATSFETWDSLRSIGRSSTETQRVIELLVHCALTGSNGPTDSSALKESRDK